MPGVLSKTNDKGVPVVSVLLAAVVGSLAFGPLKSWNALVNVVTSATAIMYAFAPLALASLHKVDGRRPRSYRVPVPAVLLPAAFCSANLIIYWGGFDTTWKLVAAMLIGLALFAIGAWRTGTSQPTIRNSFWTWPWFAGHVLIGAIGRYGGRNILPDWVDIAAVVVFSLVIFYWAVAWTLSPEQTAAALARDAEQLQVEMSYSVSHKRT